MQYHVSVCGFFIWRRKPVEWIWAINLAWLKIDLWGSSALVESSISFAPGKVGGPRFYLFIEFPVRNLNLWHCLWSKLRGAFDWSLLWKCSQRRPANSCTLVVRKGERGNVFLFANSAYCKWFVSDVAKGVAIYYMVKSKCSRNFNTIIKKILNIVYFLTANHFIHAVFF